MDPFKFDDSYEDADDIPTQFRNLYTGGEAGHTFDAERYSGVRDAHVGLTKALKNARAAEKGNIKKYIAPLADFGETPEDIVTAFEARLQAAQDAQKTAETSGNEDFTRRLEKARTELVDQQKGVVTQKDDVILGLRSQLENTLGEQAALSALSGKAVDPDLALPFVLKQLRPVEGDDGRLRMVVVDGEGDPRLDPVTQQPVTIGDLVTEMRDSEKFARLFHSDAPTGGGTAPPARPTGARNVQRTLTSAEKIALGLRKNQAQYGRGRGQI